jgi:uncharacterized membrane protein
MIKILTVAAMASFEMYAAITFGFASHLNPWEIFFASLIGGLIGVFVAAYLGDKIKAFLSKYRKPAPEIYYTQKTLYPWFTSHLRLAK